MSIYNGKIFLLFSFFLIEFVQIYSGQKKLDNRFAVSKIHSLKYLLSQEATDTSKVNLLNEISWNLTTSDFDATFKNMQTLL